MTGFHYLLNKNTCDFYHSYDDDDDDDDFNDDDRCVSFTFTV